MQIDLKDKIVLVTGGSRGIGRAIVSQLAEAGATVAIHYRHSQALAEEAALAAGREAKAFQANLALPEEVIKLAREVEDDYGRVDVLVNNAGVAEGIEMNASTASWTKSWELTQRVNLLAPSLLCKVLLPGMIDRGNGRLVHIASRAAFRGDTPEYLAYAASKGGMVAMSRSLARGYGKQGIKSFVVAPGFTRTEMAQEFIDAYGEGWATHDLALEKLTEPEDIAPTVVFLASGLMDHATGCTIDLNAGSYVH